jgi:hypothetical protein
MPRILLLIVLVWILYLIIKRVVASVKQEKSNTKKSENEKIVLCSQCGCHVPISESLIKNDQVICNNPACSNSERNE